MILLLRIEIVLLIGALRKLILSYQKMVVFEFIYYYLNNSDGFIKKNA